MKYPLISKLGLYILEKDNNIDYIHADDLEVLLEKAIVVYGHQKHLAFIALWRSHLCQIQTLSLMLITLMETD